MVPLYLSDYCKSTTDNTCDQPTQVYFQFHEHGQPMVTGALLSADQSCGTVYLWV